MGQYHAHKGSGRLHYILLPRTEQRCFFLVFFPFFFFFGHDYVSQQHPEYKIPVMLCVVHKHAMRDYLCKRAENEGMKK